MQFALRQPPHARTLLRTGGLPTVVGRGADHPPTEVWAFRCARTSRMDTSSSSLPVCELTRLVPFSPPERRFRPGAFRGIMRFLTFLHRHDDNRGKRL